MTSSFPYLTLIEAAAALGVTPGRLRWAANHRRNGDASEAALAGRLEIQKLPGGRDWLVPRPALEAELARRSSS